MWKVKAAALHGTVATLKQHGLFEQVARAVSPAARTLLEHPPARTAWIELTHLTEIDGAVLERKGPAFLRAFAREAASIGTLPGYLPLVQGMLRLFGANPHSLLTRVTPLVASHVQGIQYTYEQQGERHGRFLARYEGSMPVPEVVGITFSGLLSLVFELCSLEGKGSVSDASWRKTSTHTDVWWDLTW